MKTNAVVSRTTREAALLVTLSALLVAGCGGGLPPVESTGVEATTDDHADERIVRINDADLEQLGIEIAVAGPGRLAVTAELPGEVQVNGDRMAHVAPRVGGVVREVMASLGNTVRRGQLLAILESRELADAKAAYLAAAERLRMADATYSREERLFVSKVSSEQDYLDARQLRAEGRIEFRTAEQKLLALGVTADEIERLPDSHDVALTDYRLLAPFDGTVIDRHITLGETVAAETPVFTVADLSSVWIDLSVYQRDIGAVRSGQRVWVETNHGDEAELVIDFVQPLVGEETRTALARIIAPNPDGRWHPGCFVKAVVATSAEDEARVVVSDTAVIRMADGDDVVFVVTGKGFEPRVVTLGLRSDRADRNRLRPRSRRSLRRAGRVQPEGRARQRCVRRRPRALRTEMQRFIDAILSSRLLVIVLAVLVMIAGLFSYTRLPVDAFPDVSPNLVQVFTLTEGLAPEEIEKYVTFPVEVAMNGLPGVEKTRSVSNFGLSVVNIYFAEDIDIYFARQLVGERLQEAREQIPEGFGDPEMGPIATGMGLVLFYYLEDTTGRYTLEELRTIQDWLIKFQLQTVPGVTEVLGIGGWEKQFHVEVDPTSLLRYDVSLETVIDAIRANNLNVGAQFIERNAEELVVRSVGLATGIRDLRQIVVKAVDGTPVFLADLAEIKVGGAVRRGLQTRDGIGEVVAGQVIKLYGANSSSVIGAVEARLLEINEILPEGVRIVPYYEQKSLVDAAVRTVTRALIVGIALVTLVLLVFMGGLRASVVVALSIPFSILVALIGMRLFGLSANLMSFGGLAIAIGMMVDGTIVMVENIDRMLRQADPSESRLAIIASAAAEVGRPILFAISIIVIVFLPLFSLQGVEGKTFRPLAYTVVMAMIGSLVYSLVVAPVLASLLMRRPRQGGVNASDRVVAALDRAYRPILAFFADHRRAAVVLALSLMVIGGSGAAAARVRVHADPPGGDPRPPVDHGAVHRPHREHQGRAPGGTAPHGTRRGGLGGDPDRSRRGRRPHRSGQQRRDVSPAHTAQRVAGRHAARTRGSDPRSSRGDSRGVDQFHPADSDGGRGAARRGSGRARHQALRR